MEELLSVFNSPAFKNFVISPLAVIGFYQIFRGITMVIAKDLSTHDWPSKWLIIAYVVVTVLGCLSLIVAL